MHICFLLPSFEYYSPQSGGAIANVAMNQARELLARGHRVTVLAPDDGGVRYDIGEVIPLAVATRSTLNILQRALSSRVRRPLFHYDWPYYEYYTHAVRQVVADLKQQEAAPDAVIVFNDLETAPLLKKWLPKVRVLLRMGNEVHTNARDPDGLLRATDGIIAVSEYVRDDILRNHDVPPSHVVTVHNGVDTDLLQPAVDCPDSPFLRGEAPLQLLYIGRIDRVKAPDIVADATQALQSAGCAVELTVAGASWFYDQGGPADPYLVEMKERLDAIGAKYLGHVPRPELPAVFQKADVVGVPTRLPEPFGNVALEAMACGCAVIAANHGGLREFCDGAALLIDPAKPGDFTDALRSFYDDCELLRTYKAKALACAQEYSWKRNVDIVERMLVC
jgi:glycosyltransferase involved in cell wall biosynthesis